MVVLKLSESANSITAQVFITIKHIFGYVIHIIDICLTDIVSLPVCVPNKVTRVNAIDLAYIRDWLLVIQ